MTTDVTATTAANQVLADLAQSGGGTYEQGTLIPFRPTVGFAVAVGGLRIPAEAFTADAVLWCAKAVTGEYMESFVGTWLEDGVVSIDAVRYFGPHARKDALLLGYQTGQTAIYDFGIAESIYLGEEPVE